MAPRPRAEDEPDQPASDPIEAFGRYLRSQRQLAQLSLRQLADLAHISNPYLSQIERGLHQPSVAVIRSLAQALNLSADVLLAQAAGLDREGQPASATTEAAIRSDPLLDDGQKAALLAVYRSMLQHPGSAVPPAPRAGDRRRRPSNSKRTPTTS